MERPDPAARELGELTVRDLVEDVRATNVDAFLDEPPYELLVTTHRDPTYPTAPRLPPAEVQKQLDRVLDGGARRARRTSAGTIFAPLVRAYAEYVVAEIVRSPHAPRRALPP